jgi:hypothetical protein
MDGSGFDAWTRRRFGVAAGGATVALLAGTRSATVAKKNKKKKKRCKRIRAACSPGGNAEMPAHDVHGVGFSLLQAAQCFLRRR